MNPIRLAENDRVVNHANIVGESMSAPSQPMSGPEARPDDAPTAALAPPPLLRRVHAWVWIAAVIAALVHMAPYWRAAAVTPDGWTFMANLSASPDYMQYRVWMRQTQVEGPVVRNVFTTEPNGAHLPVFVYWAIGSAAELAGTTPEWVYAYLGGLVAIAFTVLLWLTIIRFLGGGRGAAWTFAVIMLGGGLGGYIMLMDTWDWSRGSYLIQNFFLRPFRGSDGAVLFEHFRGNYVIQALFDTHFLLFWLVTTVAVLALHSTLQRFTPLRLAGTAAAFAFGTLLHVYEGLTLLAIAAAVVALCVARRVIDRRYAIVTLLACGAAVFLAMLPVVVLFKQSGLPAPTWRGQNLLFSVVVLGYPLALGLIFYGFGRYWREADFNRIFLVGWALGGMVLLLSGPFFPYPDRGTMTLQIPLYIIAAGIWFARHRRVGWVGALAIIVLLGSTPYWVGTRLYDRTAFDALESHKWLTPDHLGVIEQLRARAARTDVLVADQTNLRWLAPEYPGLHYAGHFFLTVDFARKQEELRAFFDSASIEDRAGMLERWRARWVFLDENHVPEDFTLVPGLKLVTRTPVGSLLEFEAPTSPGGLPQ